MAKLKPWVKIAGIAIVAAGVGLGLNAAGVFKSSGKSTTDGNSGDKKESSGLFGGKSKKIDYITVGTNTYAGFLPFMYLNSGLEPNEDCILYKEYGLKMKVVIQDDFQAGRAAFKNGSIDVIYCTVDAIPVEMGEGSEMTDARVFNLSNWSRGADAIVVTKNIKKVTDLIGKVVACSEGTASHTLLLNTLETSGIGYDRVNLKSSIEPDKVNVKVVGSGLDAAAAFKAGACDAAVVFSPDDQDLVNSGLGHVLVSTKQASSIICDGLIAKQAFIDANHENLEKLIGALLSANVKMNTDASAVRQAARHFAKAYGTDEEFAIEGSKNIYYVTLEDEANFFGLRSEYTGMKGDELYSKMARTYSGLGLVRNPVSWRKASDDSVIEALLDKPDLTTGNQGAESGPVFEEKAGLETAPVFSNKSVTIEFPTGSATLDNNGKAMIDREFKTLVKQFSGARFRVEGNTDNTGSAATNEALSKKRAQAVVDYLVKECGADRNQFTVVGNGSKHAIEAGSKGSDSRYRTTDLLLISE